MTGDRATEADRTAVQEGYDRLAEEYRSARPTDGEDVAYLDHFTELLGQRSQSFDGGSRVLDAGCGPGEPITRLLAEEYEVVGVDFSHEQLRLAREHVPAAEFVQQDLTDLGLKPESFDGVVSYYALIHVPREEDRSVLSALYRLLKPGGVALLCLGASGRAEIRDEFVRSDVELFWSTYDEETYRELLADIGFRVRRADHVTDSLNPDSNHLFVLATKEKVTPAGTSNN